jgi:hypothetical protein
MLERLLDRVKSRVESVDQKVCPKEQKKAKEFSQLVKDSLGHGCVRAHGIRSDIYYEDRGSKRLYFYKEEVFDAGKSHTDYYVSDGNKIIFKKVPLGEKLPPIGQIISGKPVTDEMMQVISVKIQKIRHPLGEPHGN